MKPANFPGRKNDRRKTALARMQEPQGLGHYEKSKHPYYRTQKKIEPDSVARNIRTKKDRTARGTFRK